MQITSNNYSPACKAKFFYTDDLKNVVQHAIDTNRFDKLNFARKRIDNAYLTKRIKFELQMHPEGYPIAVFTTYTPKKGVKIPKKMSDYLESEPFMFPAFRNIKPVRFGLEMIIKLSNNAPNNRLYQKIVALKNV